MIDCKCGHSGYYHNDCCLVLECLCPQYEAMEINWLPADCVSGDYLEPTPEDVGDEIPPTLDVPLGPLEDSIGFVKAKRRSRKKNP